MKKKKLRQSLAFLMAATMALSVTGCGGSGSDDTKEKKETKSAEDTNWEGAKKGSGSKWEGNVHALRRRLRKRNVRERVQHLPTVCAGRRSRADVCTIRL